MPIPRSLRTRLGCVAAIAALCTLWPRAPLAFTWATYAIGFGHYLLALRYSGAQMRQMVASPAHVASLAGLVLLAAALYQGDFPLFLYFGVHHALNEAYSRRPATAAAPLSPHFHAAAALFQVLAYLATLRWTPELAGVEAAWIWIGVVAAAAVLAWTLAGSRAPRSPRQLLDVCAPELAAAALVLVSLVVRVTFLQVVLYHFVLWSVVPMERIRQRGEGAVAEYVGLSVAAVGVFLLISPLGPSPMSIDRHLFSEQFLFWSYLHITLSFALSDAHPSWAVRFLRGAPVRNASVSVPASG
jgi:hypothetical protein